MSELRNRPEPCRSCPYRRDVPSGVWDASEYIKLPDYDMPTAEQPFGVFLCHSDDRINTLCRGWVEVHRGQGQRDHGYDLLSLRFTGAAHLVDEVLANPCETPLFASGAEACRHGLAEADDPGDEAMAVVERLARRAASGD